jgi:hypothetical protein
MDKGNYVDLNIDNGHTGYRRCDVIAIEYSKNDETNIEEANLVVVKGSETQSNVPPLPPLVEGDTVDGSASINQMALYRVIIDGFSIVDVIKDEHGNNVVMNALTAKINDKSYAYLLGNINRAINLVKDDEITPSEFIEEFNSDEFGTVIVKYAINTGLICGDFVNDFLDPILGHSQDDMYDIVALNVQQAVYRDYRKYIKAKAGE